MEKDLFDWAAWDLVSDTLLQFYGCVLHVPIGEFEAGDVVPSILVNFETGDLQLFGKGVSKRGLRVAGESNLLSEHKVRMVLVN